MAEKLESLLKQSSRLNDQIQKEQKKSKPDISKLESLEKKYEEVQDKIKELVKKNRDQ